MDNRATLRSTMANSKDWWELKQILGYTSEEWENGYTYSKIVETTKDRVLEVRGRAKEVNLYLEEEGWEYVLILWFYGNPAVIAHFKNGEDVEHSKING